MQNKYTNQDKAIFHFNDSTDIQPFYGYFPIFADSITWFYKKPNNQLITFSPVETKRRNNLQIRDKNPDANILKII